MTCYFSSNIIFTVYQIVLPYHFDTDIGHSGAAEVQTFDQKKQWQRSLARSSEDDNHNRENVAKDTAIVNT